MFNDKNEEKLYAFYTLKRFLCQNLKAFAMKAVTHYPQARRRRNHSMVHEVLIVQAVATLRNRVVIFLKVIDITLIFFKFIK